MSVSILPCLFCSCVSPSWFGSSLFSHFSLLICSLCVASYPVFVWGRRGVFGFYRRSMARWFHQEREEGAGVGFRTLCRLLQSALSPSPNPPSGLISLLSQRANEGRIQFRSSRGAKGGKRGEAFPLLSVYFVGLATVFRCCCFPLLFCFLLSVFVFCFSFPLLVFPYCFPFLFLLSAAALPFPY